jgi:carbonic anhydrase
MGTLLHGSAVAAAWLALGAVAPAWPWSYSGADGPADWGDLDPRAIACSTGRNQSPIDLTGFVDARLEPIVFRYGEGGTLLSNDGHRIQLDVPPGSTIDLAGHRFELRQLHFHTPSEHLLAGAAFAMEVQLLHESAAGELAVVAVVFREGAPNAALEKLCSHLPRGAGERRILEAPVSPEALMPAQRDYYRYNGSLTTPPCTEGVWWLVLKHPLEASSTQIRDLSRAVGGPNARPAQAVNARIVAQ